MGGVGGGQEALLCLGYRQNSAVQFGWESNNSPLGVVTQFSQQLTPHAK